MFAARLRSRASWMARHVFVVDDVMTTGSTLDEAARVLKQGRRGTRA